uniref:Poly(ADP-ribose) polymerase family member 8 n=1 Tax=Mus spicilegus TaxID=10103 RepID=A0A8C6H9U0_MUSSI
MGTCSRQERIQKDIDVVIQKSRAEKDCLFADFRYSDSTFTFTYIGGPKRSTNLGSPSWFRDSAELRKLV